MRSNRRHISSDLWGLTARTTHFQIVAVALATAQRFPAGFDDGDVATMDRSRGPPRQVILFLLTLGDHHGQRNRSSIFSDLEIRDFKARAIINLRLR
jgi:hypothetical protein